MRACDYLTYMKDLRVKKRNIDLTYQKAFKKLIEEAKKEILRYYRDSGSNMSDLNIVSGVLTYKGVSLNDIPESKVWEIYERLFNRSFN